MTPTSPRNVNSSVAKNNVTLMGSCASKEYDKQVREVMARDVEQGFEGCFLL
ncbi:hypothetical protein ACU8KH_05240 [Lachancea thermotolerans]